MSQQPFSSKRRLSELAQQSAAILTDGSKMDRMCQRREVRLKDHRLALLRTGNGDDIPCVITEISENGARVRLKMTAVLPPFVTVKDSNDGSHRRARVAWQRDSSAGLSFRLDQRATFASAGPR